MSNPTLLIPTEAHDSVNHPAHYNVGAIEVIDAIESWRLGFHLGNAVKYIARCDHKGQPIEDLKKAYWYLEREITRREKLPAAPAEGAMPIIARYRVCHHCGNYVMPINAQCPNCQSEPSAFPVYASESYGEKMAQILKERESQP